jgi:putative endonuclease
VTYTVYILRTSSNTLYTGQTNNLEKRLKEHKGKTGRSSKYMRSFKSFKLVYSEKYPTLSQALKREIEIKKMSHQQKEELISDIN